MANDILLLGLIILIGVVGNLLFTRTRIPESLFLIVMGLVIGPGLGLVSQEFFSDNLGLFLSFALVIVLINSGMNIELRRAMRTMRVVLLFTLLVFLCTVAVVTGTLRLLFGWPVLHGVFLGIIVSGTTTVTITHLVDQLRKGQGAMHKETGDLLVLESIVNDVTVIAGASILVAIISPGAIGTQEILMAIFNEFLVSTLIGIALGIAWVLLYAYRLHANPLSYILTVGVSLTLYAVAEYLSLNGAIAVISFAIIVGNYRLVLEAAQRHAHIGNLKRAVDAMRRTDIEFTFLIRTFFFVLLGIIFDPAVLRMQDVLLIAAAILACKFIARYLAAVLLTTMHHQSGGDHLTRTTLVANGFTSTLAAFLAVQAGIEIPHLAEIVLLLVIATTITAIASTAVHQHLMRRATPLAKGKR